MKYPIHERFFSWQGEGVHMGRAAFFVRLFGCPVHCPWCDSAGTWHKDHIPRNIEKRTAKEIVAEISKEKPDFVVITGGEPAIHDLTELSDAIHSENLPVHLETSGAFPIRGNFNWITLSPKWNKLPLEENYKLANELKIIVEDQKSISKWGSIINSHIKEVQNIWLHPEWSVAKDFKVLTSITEFIKSHGSPFRAGYQMHKMYQADELDSRSR